MRSARAEHRVLQEKFERAFKQMEAAAHLQLSKARNKQAMRMQIEAQQQALMAIARTPTAANRDVERDASAEAKRERSTAAITASRRSSDTSLGVSSSVDRDRDEKSSTDDSKPARVGGAKPAAKAFSDATKRRSSGAGSRTARFAQSMQLRSRASRTSA